MQGLQQFLAVNKKTIVRWWHVVLIIWFAFFLLSTQLFSVRFWLEIGKLSGTASLITFWIVLTPGILKRFQIGAWLLPIRTILMLFRRQLGITMYVLALTHYWWSRMMPILSFGGDIFSVQPSELMGLIAFALLTPLFFTSNNWAVKHLGRWWDRIHSLVYVVIWILFLHVGLQEFGWKTFITLIVAAVELFSLIWAKSLAVKNQN